MKRLMLISILIAIAIGLHAQTFFAFNSKPLDSIVSFKSKHAVRNKDIALPPFTFDAISTKDKIYIDFVGTGDIQKSISQGQDINANTGLGIIFERYRGPDVVIQSLELEALINIATTADTIFSQRNETTQLLENQRDFGSYILNPISAKQSLFINSVVYFGYPKKKKGAEDLKVFGNIAKVISGFNVRVISSNNVWDYDKTTKNLGVMAIRSGIFHEFIPDNYRLTKDEMRSKYSLFIGINYAFRGIFGDIASSKNNDWRSEVLGSYQKAFHGVEFNFGFRLNNLRAEFQMPILKNKDGAIEGLTNTQFIFSIKFVGGFSLKLDPKKED